MLMEEKKNQWHKHNSLFKRYDIDNYLLLKGVCFILKFFFYLLV